VRFYSSIASEATLSSGINGSDTAITVEDATGYPANTPFTIVLDPDTASEEIVDVTGVSGDNWTITRAVDGTVGLSHGAGAKVRHMGTARDFREPQEHIDASTGVHGLSGGEGAVVGTSKTQTLTGKTMSGASNTFSAIPQASVTNLATNLASINSELDGVGDDLAAHAADTSAHGVTSGVMVGTTQSQALTNKTINTSSNTITVEHADVSDRYFLLMEGVETDVPGGTLARNSWTTIASRGTWASDGHTSRRAVPKTGLYRVTYTTGWAGTEVVGAEVNMRVYNIPLDGGSAGTLLGRMDKSREPGDFWVHLSATAVVNSGRGIGLFVNHNVGNWVLRGGLENTRVLIEYLGPAT